MVYLLHCSVQCHFWSFDAHVSKWDVTRIRLVVERNTVKLRLSGTCNTYKGHLSKIGSYMGVRQNTNLFLSGK